MIRLVLSGKSVMLHTLAEFRAHRMFDPLTMCFVSVFLEQSMSVTDADEDESKGRKGQLSGFELLFHPSFTC